MRGNSGREGAVDREEGTQYINICKFFEGLLRHPVLTPKTIGRAALVKVFAVILLVEATTPVVDAPPDIGSESMVGVTLDVTAATTTTAAVMAPSILWAFISSLARLRRVKKASPGDPGCFLLSSMVLIVTGEIPGRISLRGRCHTLDTGALDDVIVCSAARCFWEIPSSRKLNFDNNGLCHCLQSHITFCRDFDPCWSEQRVVTIM